MSTLRNALAASVMVLLGAGYAASQWAFFTGQSARYAEQVDSTPIRILALLILGLAIALGLLPEKEEQ